MREHCGLPMIIGKENPANYLVMLKCQKCDYFVWVGDRYKEKEMGDAAQMERLQHVIDTLKVESRDAQDQLRIMKQEIIMTQGLLVDHMKITAAAEKRMEEELKRKNETTI